MKNGVRGQLIGNVIFKDRREPWATNQGTLVVSESWKKSRIFFTKEHMHDDNFILFQGGPVWNSDLQNSMLFNCVLLRH